MIYVAESAREKISEIRSSGKIADDYFLRVSVTSGGCSGLSYKLDFDNESKPNDQVFEDNGVKVVTDLKSFLYLFNTTLEFSAVYKEKALPSITPTPRVLAAVGKVFQCRNTPLERFILPIWPHTVIFSLENRRVAVSFACNKTILP